MGDHAYYKRMHQNAQATVRTLRGRKSELEAIRDNIDTTLSSYPTDINTYITDCHSYLENGIRLSTATKEDTVLNYKESASSDDGKIQSARSSIVSEIASVASALSTAESDEAYYGRKRYEAAEEEKIPWWNR
ncbi:MAG: hypothetical protein J6B50_07585 [Lachnospiraceae bacterium]|nr:hypothetical protein [Lachnospiraceae bacterium]MBP3506773.1 hypothetical protein [Lachnospiraceae bacterium]